MNSSLFPSLGVITRVFVYFPHFGTTFWGETADFVLKTIFHKIENFLLVFMILLTLVQEQKSVIAADYFSSGVSQCGKRH